MRRITRNPAAFPRVDRMPMHARNAGLMIRGPDWKDSPREGNLVCSRGEADRKYSCERGSIPLYIPVKKLQRAEHGVAKIFRYIVVVAFVLVIFHGPPCLLDLLFQDL